MNGIRALVWAGALGWVVVAIDFGVSLAWRLFSRRGRERGGLMLRLSWSGSAVGGACYLLSRLGALGPAALPLPFLIRISLDVGLALAGVVCGFALLHTLALRGWEVLR